MYKKLKQKLVYPKLLLLLICIAVSYEFFQTHLFELIAAKLNHEGYLSVFLAGCLFSYGFTTPFAIGLFLTVGDNVNIFYAAPLAAVGALLSDFLIFKFIRSELLDEFNRLKKTRPIQALVFFLKEHLRPKAQIYLSWIVGGIIIASPLPDELGVSLLSGFSRINQKAFIVIDYFCNLTGIAIFLALA